MKYIDNEFNNFDNGFNNFELVSQHKMQKRRKKMFTDIKKVEE